MAMGRAVVASTSCAAPIDALVGSELLAANEAADFVSAVSALLVAPDRAHDIGEAARQCVLKRYSWQSHLAGIERHITAGATA